MLVQLPERFHRDTARLAAALDEFPAAVRVAVELRHDSWWRDDVYEVLAAHGAALLGRPGVAVDHSPAADRGVGLRPLPLGVVVTAAVLRTPDAGRARPRPRGRLAGDDDDVYVYFNNDPRCCAVRDAALFARACDRLAARRTRVPATGEVRVVR